MGKNLKQRQKFWDQYSEKYEHSTDFRKKNILTKKINDLHLILAKKTISMIETKKPRVLKTDLWNEVVEPNRSILPQLAEKPLSFYAVELSPRLCRRAKKILGKKVNIRCSDIKKTGFRKNFFDAVIDISTIDHVPPKETATVIKESARIIKPGGSYLLIFNNPGVVWKTIQLYSKMSGKKQLESYNLDEKNVKKALEENGFTIKKEYATDDWSFILDIASKLHVHTLLEKTPFLGKIISLWQKIELSPASCFFGFMSRQRAIIATKTKTQNPPFLQTRGKKNITNSVEDSVRPKNAPKTKKNR